MRCKLLLLSILLWSNVSLLNSQTPDKSRINIYVSDKSNKSVILVGAHIRIISGTDSIAGITTKYSSELATLACFRSNKLLRDSVDIHISHIGYKPLHKRYSAEQFQKNIYVEMEQDEHMLSQIVIVGQSVAMVIKGDTTIYNSASFKTMDGDRFAALLAQLPGIEIKSNKIYANGEEIKRVYVDGRNLFGTNSSNTLTDIEANDVKNVKIYDEENAIAKHLGDKTTPKDKVMDVITHSKRNVIQGGSISIAAGASIEKDYSNKHEKRHSEDISLYRNSETGSIRLTASNSKNDGHKDNISFNSKVTPSEHTDVYLLYDYRRGDSTTIMTHANFKRNSNQKIETILSEYFPTDQYKSRTTENTSNSMDKIWNMDAANSITIMRGKSILSSDLSFAVDKSENRSTMDTRQAIDNKYTYTNIHNNNDINNISIKAMLNYRTRVSERSSVMIDASGNYSKQNNNGWSIDTLASTSGLRVLLNNNANSRQTSISASSEFKRELSENSALSIAYIYAHSYNKSKQKSIDYLSESDGRLDSINSYDYTINSSWNTISTSWNYSNNHRSGTVGFRSSIYNVNNDERIPEVNNSPHTFLIFNPFANFSIGSMQSRWNFSFGSFSDILSVEMLRNSLDASNPMYIRAGNPNLRPSNNANFNINYSTTNTKQARILLFEIKGGYIFNYIASQQTLFTKDTYLPEYNYMVQNGAQLNTNINVGGNYNLGGSIKYSQRVAFLKSTLRASIHYDYKQTPYYLGDDLHKSYNHEIKTIIGVNTGFSENIRINLNSSTKTGYYTTNNKTTSYINESLNCSIDLRFASKYFVLTKAVYEIYNNNQPSVSAQNNIIANVAFGRKLGRENQASLSIGVVDICNQTSYSSTILNSDYIRTSTTSYLGRYGYLLLSYTF